MAITKSREEKKINQIDKNHRKSFIRQKIEKVIQVQVDREESIHMPSSLSQIDSLYRDTGETLTGLEKYN